MKKIHWLDQEALEWLDRSYCCACDGALRNHAAICNVIEGITCIKCRKIYFKRKQKFKEEKRKVSFPPSGG